MKRPIYVVMVRTYDCADGTLMETKMSDSAYVLLLDAYFEMLDEVKRVKSRLIEINERCGIDNEIKESNDDQGNYIMTDGWVETKISIKQINLEGKL